jgi:hypothetical protein
MVKITKRVVEAAEAQEKNYLIWDDELAGFGLRSLVLASAATSSSIEREVAHVAIRYYSPCPAPQFREHRQRSRLYRGNHRGFWSVMRRVQ